MRIASSELIHKLCGQTAVPSADASSSDAADASFSFGGFVLHTHALRRRRHFMQSATRSAAVILDPRLRDIDAFPRAPIPPDIANITLLFGSVPSIYLCLYRERTTRTMMMMLWPNRNEPTAADRIAANDTLIPNMQWCSGGVVVEGGGCRGGGG